MKKHSLLLILIPILVFSSAIYVEDGNLSKKCSTDSTNHKTFINLKKKKNRDISNKIEIPIANSTCTPTSKSYTLINLVGASKSGTTITKTSETSWMNAGGTTNLVLSEGDYITYKVATAKGVTVGLSSVDQDCSNTTIENGLYTRSDNKIYIYENGVSILSTQVSYTSSSVLKIKIEGGKVKYYIGATLLYQKTTSLTASQVVDFSMYDKDSEIKELQIYKCCVNSDDDLDGVCNSDEQCPGANDSIDENQNGIPDCSEVLSTYIEKSFELTGLTGSSPSGTDTKRTITKSAVTTWGNAGGSTNIKISDGQYIQYKVKKDMNVMVGFSQNARTSTNFGSIENSLYTRFDNNISAYQGAVNRSGIIKSYTESSVFKIMYQGGRVKFFCDENLIYVAATVYTTKPDLFIDFLLNSYNSQIVDLQIFCPLNTFKLSSSVELNSQTICSNTGITPITYTTTGAIGIGTATGLPTGLISTFTSNTITISGTPTVSGTFNYSIPLTGGCGTVAALGTITITIMPNNTVSIASSSPISCVDSLLENVTHTTTGATGMGTITGLPEGLTSNFLSNTITVSGTPTVSGTFNYSIPLTGGCGSVSANGTIIVKALPQRPTATVIQPSFCTSPTGSVILSDLPSSGTWILSEGENQIYTGTGATFTVSNLNLDEYLYSVTHNGCESDPIAINIIDSTTTWTGTTWNPIPPSNTVSVVINGVYTTSINGGNFNARSLVVNNGAILNIDGNYTITVQNCIANNGIVNITNNGSLTCNSND